MSRSLDYHAMGERMQRRRRELGLTQEQLAEAADITPSFVGHLERAEKKPSVETVARVCDALSITADYLLRGQLNRCDQQTCALYLDMQSLLGCYGERR